MRATIALLCLLAAMRAHADVGLVQVCTDATPAGSPLGNCAAFAYERPAARMLVASRASGDSCTWSGGTCAWHAFGDLSTSEEVRACAIDVPLHTAWTYGVSDPCKDAQGADQHVWIAPSAALPPTSGTGSVSLSWTPPTENEDGTPLTDLAGYRLYYGATSGDYTAQVDITDRTATSYIVESLAPGTWYFALTAVNAAGAESAKSNEAMANVVAGETVPLAPTWNIPPAPSSSAATITSTRIDASEWTCRDSSGVVLSSHTREDKAFEACANRALAAPGTAFEIRPSGYRVIAQ